jgi:hypothetical protein
MSTYDELLSAVKAVRDRTGDPNAWQTGLTPNEIAAAMSPVTRPEQLDSILNRIRQRHPDVFATGPAPPDGQQGEAARAMAAAEAALAHQNSASSQLDLQVISAILNAHLKTVEGGEALTTLQEETEAAVRTRSDLDTPAGARDFQRFLIGKLRDIHAVVADANLDNTSKSALMAAWTSLYDASRSGLPEAPERQPTPADPVATSSHGAAPPPPAAAAGGPGPSLDSLLADDPGALGGDPAARGPAEGAVAPAAPATPTMPAMPSVPSLGAGGATPGSLAGWGAPSGTGLHGGGETDPALARLDDEPDQHKGDHKVDHKEDDGQGKEGGAAASDKPELPAGGPTSVTLPDGETVTAASPQLAAVIKAAVGGLPIADAFHQQGITIPPPGTAVADPIEPFRAIPGDVGFFTDRHALALGHSKALLDGQIQQMATVSGPSFLGWDHPPAAATATAPAKTEAPTPTRPAATSTT